MDSVVESMSFMLFSLYFASNETDFLGLGSGTSLLERDWTQIQPGAALRERQRAAVDVRESPRLAACTLGFTLVDERVTSLFLQAGEQVHNVHECMWHHDPLGRR